MTKPDRNAICPCGSGKKYKRCCLIQEREAENRGRHEANSTGVALGWLTDRYPEEVEKAIHGRFLDPLDPSQFEELGRLPEGLLEMLDLNMNEWLLAEGELEVEGRTVFAGELILGVGGPILSAVQRQYIEKLFIRPLGLYEVEESRPGEGLSLRDTLQREETSRIWVQERQASKDLGEGMILAARLIPGEPWKISGAIYPIPAGSYLRLRERLSAELEGVTEPVEARRILSSEIIAAWMNGLVAPPPEIVDASTGKPIMLTTDHYQVSNWQDLGAVLATQPDVEGDRSEGWVRLEKEKDGLSRSLASLNLGKKDRLEVFTRSIEMADAAREWLEELAGDAVKFLVRGMTDPASLWKDRHGSAEPKPASPGPPNLAPETMTALFQDVLNRTYENWADESLPLLAHKSPREAIATKRGLDSVVELLRSYERGERDQAKAQGRQPANFAFLWKSLGLVREDYL